MSLYREEEIGLTTRWKHCSNWYQTV